LTRPSGERDGKSKEESIMTLQSRMLKGFHCTIVAVVLAFAAPDRAAAETAPAQPLTTAQLEQLVAPIALHPDALLSQILMASTYPLDVVEAARWSQANPGAAGQALKDAVLKQPWDPSVKALTAVPQTLQMMNDKLEWTRQLGDAFLAQQKDLLDAVQRLRKRADAAGNLKTTAEQKVTKSPATRAAPAASPRVATAASADIYTIESANPDAYDVPIYDPNVVYGAWPYASYEPFYWYPPGYVATAALVFARRAFVGAAIWGTVDWRRHSVGINPLRYSSFTRTSVTSRTWTHNPAPRGAVAHHGRSAVAAREAFRSRTQAGRHQVTHHTSRVAHKGPTGSRSTTAAHRTTAAAHRTRTTKAATRHPTRSAHVATRQAHAHHRPSATRYAGTHARAQVTSHVARPSVGMRSSGMRVGGFRGGRRSDARLKHDIVLLGRLDNGLGFYRFVYNGGHKIFVGVMAQEVQSVMPRAVARDRHGYLLVFYDKLGLRFDTYNHWVASGARIPPIVQPGRAVLPVPGV
jgi:hypothetical protein